MMINRGRMNRMPVNAVMDGGMDARLVLVLGEQARAMVGSGENIHEAMFAAEAVEGLGRGAAGEHEAQALDVRLGAGGRAYAVYMLSGRLAGQMDGRAQGLTTTWLAADCGAKVLGYAFFGRELVARLEGADVFGGAARSGQDLRLPVTLADVAVGAAVSGRELVCEEAVFDLYISPGSVLEIDSDGYTVTLDGRSVIDAQRGAWLRLDRDVVDVRVEAAMGRVSDLVGEISYRTKWI